MTGLTLDLGALGVTEEDLIESVLSQLGMTAEQAVEALAEKLGVEDMLPSEQSEDSSINSGDVVSTTQGQAKALVLDAADRAALARIGKLFSAAA